MIFKHKHKWNATIPFTIKKGEKEFARVMCYCKCGAVIHKHLPSLDELKKREETDTEKNECEENGKNI